VRKSRRIAAGLTLMLTACAHGPIEPRGPGRLATPVASDEIRQRVVLLGDAGKLSGGTPILAGLAKGLAQDPALLSRTAVVFLGDNLYPNAAQLRKGKPEARAALEAQAAAAQGAGHVLFVPGNHDWDDAARSAPFAEGLASLQAMAEFVESRERAAPAVMTPPPGCPGPERIALDGLELVVLDSEWWFQPAAERTAWAHANGCETTTEEEVLAGLREALRCADGGTCAPRIVVAHHPLETGGEHGGYFPWHEHLACLGGRLPLPVFCSIYVAIRVAGVSHTDTQNARYRHYIESVEEALRESPPLVFAAGHDHVLQVIKGRYAGYLLVSGSASKTAAVQAIPGTLFAQSQHGYMWLDLLHDGRIVLRVFSSPDENVGEPVYELELRAAR
jgi:hypothetical protein